MPRALAIALSAALLGASAPVAAATDEPLDDFYIPDFRSAGRLIFGFDIGVGLFDGTCTGCRSLGGLGLDLYAGRLLTPRIALVGEAWNLVHVLPSDGEDSGLALHTVVTLAGRLWILPEVWMSTGIGAGFLAIASERQGSDPFRAGPAAMFAIGAEVEHRPDFGVDLALRLGITLLDDDSGRSFELISLAAMVGWHWY